MPQKSKKLKVKTHQRKEADLQEQKNIDTDEKDQKRILFVKDIRKSLVIISTILVAEIGLYLAASSGLLPFIPVR